MVGNGVERRPDLFGASGEKAGQVEYLHVFEAIAAQDSADRTHWKLTKWVKVHVSCALKEEGKNCGDNTLVLGGGKLVGSRSASGEEGLWEPADQHRVVEQLEVVEEAKEDCVDDFVLCQLSKRLASACT